MSGGVPGGVFRKNPSSGDGVSGANLISEGVRGDGRAARKRSSAGVPGAGRVSGSTAAGGSVIAGGSSSLSVDAAPGTSSHGRGGGSRPRLRSTTVEALEVDRVRHLGRTAAALGEQRRRLRRCLGGSSSSGSDSHGAAAALADAGAGVATVVAGVRCWRTSSRVTRSVCWSAGCVAAEPGAGRVGGLAFSFGGVGGARAAAVAASDASKKFWWPFGTNCNVTSGCASSSGAADIAGVVLASAAGTASSRIAARFRHTW